jgi:hypothetical protein
LDNYALEAAMALPLGDLCDGVARLRPLQSSLARQKNTFDARIVAHSNPGMCSFVESTTRVDSVTFRKQTPNGIKRWDSRVAPEIGSAGYSIAAEERRHAADVPPHNSH